jgi:hypothetical protein
MMNAADELTERMAILELTARYADIADHQDWEALTSLFTPTAVFEAESVYGSSYRGTPEILKFYNDAPLATGHHPTGVYTVFDSDDRAQTRLKMLVLFPKTIFTVDYGWELLKTDGTWKIQHMTIDVIGRNELRSP